MQYNTSSKLYASFVAMIIFFFFSENTICSEEQILESSSSTPALPSINKSTYKKPMRPCVYCGQFETQLVRHLKRKHTNEEAVQAAIKLPASEQRRAFEIIRKNGIYVKNVEKNVDECSNVDLIRERRQGESKVVMCTGCRGFYSKTRIYKHKKVCSHNASLHAGGHRSGDMNSGVVWRRYSTVARAR